MVRAWTANPPLRELYVAFNARDIDTVPGRHGRRRRLAERLGGRLRQGPRRDPGVLDARSGRRSNSTAEPLAFGARPDGRVRGAPSVPRRLHSAGEDLFDREARTSTPSRARPSSGTCRSSDRFRRRRRVGERELADLVRDARELRLGRVPPRGRSTPPAGPCEPARGRASSPTACRCAARSGRAACAGRTGSCCSC